MAIDEVIKYLQKNRGWYRVMEISRAIDMAHTNVNKHLKNLLIDERVDIKQIKCNLSGKMINVWKIKNCSRQRYKEKNNSGYVLIYKPNHNYSLTKKGWIHKHRAIVEDFIKRNLKEEECIHHIDSNKLNNNINNLMLFKNHQQHSSFHQKIKQFGFTNPILRQIENRWEDLE